METIVLDGVEYAKSAQVAKRFGYTADYLGQLCREKKVESRMVGRSWFVSIVSVEEYKQSVADEVVKNDGDDTSTDVSVRLAAGKMRPVAITPVATPLRNKTIKSFGSDLSPARSHKVSYELDGSPLLPELSSSMMTRLHTSKSTTKTIKIKTPRGDVARSYRPASLPAVSLQGKVPVTKITNSLDEIPKKNNAVSSKPAANKTTSQTDSVDRARAAIMRAHRNKTTSHILASRSQKPSSDVVLRPFPKTTNYWLWILVLVVTIICVALLFLLETIITVDQFEQTKNLRLI